MAETRDQILDRLIAGGMETEAALKASEILSKAGAAKGVSDATQKRIERANARVQKGTGWNSGGAQ